MKSHYNLGVFLAKHGDTAGAEAAIFAGIAMDPQLPDAHFSLGVLLGKRGDHAGAAASFVKVVQIDPSFPNAQQFLTSALEAVRKSRS